MTSTNYSKTEVNKARKMLDKFFTNVNNNICCQYCGREMIQSHIYDIHCEKCLCEILQGKSKVKSQSCKYNEREYIDNFIINTTNPFLLTITGFNIVSNIKVQAYTNYYKMIWVDIIKKYHKYEDLYNYIINEYENYYESTGNQNIINFCDNHKYITYKLLTGIGLDQIYEGVGLVKQRYFDDDYKNNFLNIVNSIGYIPLYSQFIDNTKINIYSYSNKFNLHKNIYDEIVKMYSSANDYKDYLKRKKQHKSEIGKEIGKLSRIYSDEDLRKMFIDVFENYYLEHNKYPSRREFDKNSTYDSSGYRRRYNKSWTEVCGIYGYKTQQQNKNNYAH